MKDQISFFLFLIFTYVFGCMGLSCHMQDLSLWTTDSLAVACGLSSWGTQA